MGILQQHQEFYKVYILIQVKLFLNNLYQIHYLYL